MMMTSSGDQPSPLRPSSPSKSNPMEIPKSAQPSVTTSFGIGPGKENEFMPSSPTESIPVFRSTLQKERHDLTDSAIRDLNRHTVSRELSSQILGRFRSDTSYAAAIVDNFPVHPDFAESVSSTSETSSLLQFKEDQEAKKRDREARLRALRDSRSPSNTDHPEDRKRHGPIRPSLPARKNSRRVPTPSSARNRLQSGLSVPAQWVTTEGRMVPAVKVSPEFAQTMSSEEIEWMLDSLLPHHEAEYNRDQERIKVEEVLLAKGFAVIKDEVEGDELEPRRCSHPRLKKLSIAPFGVEMLRNDRSTDLDDECPFCTYENAGYETNEESVSEQEDIDWDNEDNGPMNDCAEEDTLLMIRTHGENRRSSGSSHYMDGAFSLSLQTNPGGETASAFAGIFIVCHTEGFAAPLSALGRPLIPDTIRMNRYTVVASFHPFFQHLVVDIVDFVSCPTGFTSNQLIDLVYLQKGGYIPPYIVWPPNLSSPDHFQVAPQWSVCATYASGNDILYVSDFDVLVQRLVGSMFRVSETRNMTLGGRRRFLDSIARDCVQECSVMLTINAGGLAPDSCTAMVSVDFTANARWEWVDPDDDHCKFGHSRNCLPVV